MNFYEYHGLRNESYSCCNFLDFLNCLAKLFRFFHLFIYPKKLRMSLKFS